MILADTSVWIEHLRKGNQTLQRLLDQASVLCHPMVVGELAMGEMNPREAILGTLSKLPSAVEATHNEALRFITHNRLNEAGIGYIDVHLLASVRLTSGASLWTLDVRLAEIADTLNIAFSANP